MKLTQINFPTSQYFEEEYPKSQIFLHHTAGGPNAHVVFQGWASNQDKIATCVSISADGEIVQGFSSKFWAYHLGLKTSVFSDNGVPYKSLDKTSIGIEICNWGQLTQKDGKFFNYVNKEIPANQVCTLEKPYKGFKFFHNYTDAQIQAVKELLLLWKEKYNIPLTYNEDIWGISLRCLKGEKGVYTHNSCRKDKIDIYPHPKMIEMLKSL